MLMPNPLSVGPATTRTRYSSCNFTSLSERNDSDDEEDRTKSGPSEPAVRMKPKKLFQPNVTKHSMKKG